MSIKEKAVIECYENYREEDRLTTMEQIYEENDLSIIDHFAQDGMTPMFADKVDTWPKEKFELWCEHHYQTCRQKSLLGMSNHVLIAGKKC